MSGHLWLHLQGADMPLKEGADIPMVLENIEELLDDANPPGSRGNAMLADCTEFINKYCSAGEAQQIASKLKAPPSSFELVIRHSTIGNRTYVHYISREARRATGCHPITLCVIDDNGKGGFGYF